MHDKISDNTKAVLSMKIVGSYCTSCVAVLTRSLLAHEGIYGVKINPQFDGVRVEYSTRIFNREEIKRIIDSTVSDSFMSHKTEASENTVIDPVCHMMVHVDGDTLYSDFDKMRYYFCTKSCKIAFEKDSELFLN